MARMMLIGALLVSWVATAQAAEISGRVTMPETCAHAVSPAVVLLEPDGWKPEVSPSATPGALALVRQSGLMFQPRVQSARLGQTIEFTNEDSETHSVHNVGAGNRFNMSMSPGQRLEIPADAPGVIQLVCDVHSHMRGYVVVSRWPWTAVCRPDGSFRIDGVPAGKYRMRIWHEMGDPLERPITVGGTPLDLGTIAVTGSATSRVVLSVARRPWPQVVDRVGVLLSESLAVVRSDGLRHARKLVDDAYFAEFEASQMETAVRRYLGFERAGEIEEQFRSIRKALADVADRKLPASRVASQVRALMADLVKTGAVLNQQGIVDGSKIVAAEVATTPGASPASSADTMLVPLAGAFREVRTLADRGEPEEAASALVDAYFQAFEPIERALLSRGSLAVPELEARFNALRGRVSAGLKGQELARALASFHDDTATALNRSGSSSRGWGAFGASMGASFVTILREGVEVILLLTMLGALVARSGRADYRNALVWGVCLAVIASLGTAAALRMMLASAQGRAGELLEGCVMLAAAVLLFYVSYWLISRTEARRWADFLKRQASHGAELGSFWTLGLTAFLAVYREGAETALMYQAMLGSQASRAGELGIAVGLLIGLAALAVVYVLLRKASVKLPIQAFFKLSGFVLFAMAVVFAGKAVFELQNSGIIRVTALPWLGKGLPLLGLYPNTQVVAVQGLLVAGALFAMLVLLTGEPAAAGRPVEKVRPSSAVVAR